MNILVVSDVLADEVNNGTDIATVNLINYLKGRGDTVKVLCANESKKDDPDYFVVPTLNLYMLNNYVKKNNVILASADKKIIDKDVSSIYQTKGDNNSRADSALVYTDDIYGKVLFKVPKIGYVQNALSNPIYFVSCFLTVGMIFIFYELYRIIYMLVKRRII